MPNTPKDEVETLINALVPMVKEHLEHDGGFYPFGGVITNDGDGEVVAANTADEHHAPDEIIEQLTGVLHQRACAGDIRVAALVADVRVTKPGSSEETDAIQFRMDHRDGYAVDVYVPYKLPKPGVVTLGDLFAQEAEASFFAETCDGEASCAHACRPVRNGHSNGHSNGHASGH